ncbi:MAG: hypothetical protein APF81_08985 [Desulfosporosinus sp. BRH_c37]|nr:MAG: hypothetical protein APF81_08985 [Desulfosporosinus sp. BRH_c37]
MDITECTINQISKDNGGRRKVKLSKKLIIIIATVLVLVIGGGVAYATNTPTARADRELKLANKYLQDGKYQEAILAFEKVIQIEPKNIPARLGLGKVYVATKEFTKAETVLKEVIEIDQNNIPAREALFNVYLKEGNLDNAKTILKGISEVDPNKDVKQFNTDLESAKAISVSKASYDQGIKQMGDKQYLEAVDSFQKVIKEDTERYTDAQTKTSDCKKAFIDTTLQKAKDAAANNDYQTALNLIEQILKVDPNNQEALNLKSEYTNKVIQNKYLAQSIVHSDMRDTQNQIYKVFIYADDVVTKYDDEPVQTNNRGDLLKIGNFKIGYMKQGSDQLQIYQQGIFSEKHTFNMSNHEVRFFENKQSNQPDLIIVSRPMTSSAFSISVFYIKNNELTPIKFVGQNYSDWEIEDYGDGNSSWFVQTGADTFENMVVFDHGGDGSVHHSTWKLDQANNVFHFVSDRKVN